MKSGLSQKPLQLVWIAVIGISPCVTDAKDCFADANISGPLVAQVTLVTSSTASLGEPIVVHYKISNSSTTQQLSFDAGPRQMGWYRLSMTNAQGQKIVQPLPEKSSEDVLPQGLHQAPEISLLPGETIEGDVVATQALPVTKPGGYTLTFSIPIGYYLEPRGAWYPLGRPADQVPISFIRDYKFHLKVTRANPERLRITAETLKHELQDVRFAGQWKALLTALSSLPEAVALPSWQSLVMDPATPSTVVSDAVEMLGGLRSTGAADLLGQALFDRVPTVGANESSVKASAQRAVAEMYSQGNDQVKLRLEQVYVQHGASKDDLLQAVTLSNPN